jgi:tetratricopeptide (TPR) repeat protein
MTDPLVGTAVAHYEVLAKLGGGGMGVVYTARDARLGRLVALKFLPPQWSHDDSAKQRFLREAQAASATHHRNICTIHDIETTDDGRLFIVMAYYEGQTLKQRLEAGALAIEEAVEIAAQVAEGLAKAHLEGVVHRDIKPGNLIMAEDDVKILDFGLAKFANALQLTLEGSTLGTVAYMSPEQTRGEEADARSDIWAVGVVLYEMLTGTLPFKGAYPEAISHAIRNEPTPQLRVAGKDTPPGLNRIVDRALRKNAAERYQNARELARDLRLLQGRTIPLDLLTAPLVAPPLVRVHRARRWTSPPVLIAASLVVAMLAGVPLWLFAPVERVPVVVAPMVNQTGYAELEAYRRALTQELVAELSESSMVRVLPYDRELQILRRFTGAGQDISSREAIQALTANSGARVVIVPTLLYENGAWRARVEFRDARTATNMAVQDTPPVVSSLVKDTAYGLMPKLNAAIDAYFTATGSRRVTLAHALRQMAGRGTPAPQSRMRTLDAVSAFERGLDAYEQMEYGAALRSFGDAVALDPRNAPLVAWRTLVADIMRRDDEAGAAAEQAVRLLTDRSPMEDRLFVEGVAAEARRDRPTAEARYRALRDRHPDDPAAVMLFGAFQDRQNLNADAVHSYLQALELDIRQARPHVELCRMYNRLNEAATAKEHAQKALAAYRGLGARSGEGQALFCLADALRGGSDADREEARRHAESAVNIFSAIDAPYNLARAYNYSATIAGMQNRPVEAAAFGEKALAAARAAGNVVLQPLVLMNLGVTYEALGDRARAADYYQQSAKLYEAQGDETRAAEIQTNRAILLVTYGSSSGDVVRDARNALAVLQKVGDKKFEIAALQVIATADRNAGRHADAERELNRALAIAKERDFKDDFAESTVDLAKSRLELGNYASVLNLLTQALGDGSGPVAPSARVLRARTLTRLGDFDGAQLALTAASADAARRGDTGLIPSIETVYGELAYESGKLREAREHFERASALWTDDLPNPESVQARAYIGLLDALAGRAGRGRPIVTESLAQAQKMGQLSLEVRCRTLLARINVMSGRAADALAALRDVAPDGDRAIGPELQAQVHYWRASALAGMHDLVGAGAEYSLARGLLQQLRSSIPEPARTTFDARADIASKLRASDSKVAVRR